MIRVWVWREKDYSGDFPVDARGTVTLPVLGEISASGHTAEQLADTLREAYRKYLNNPSIDVTVLRRVVVQGEVAKPGLYPADATISIGELIALAGGVTPNGNRSRIELLRNGQVLVSGLGPGAVLQRSPIQSGDVIVVPQKSWFSRNGQVFLYAGVSLVTAVLARLIVK
jgi:polysaccharide export outer membrane protein